MMMVMMMVVMKKKKMMIDSHHQRQWTRTKVMSAWLAKASMWMRMMIDLMSMVIEMTMRAIVVVVVAPNSPHRAPHCAELASRQRPTRHSEKKNNEIFVNA